LEPGETGWNKLVLVLVEAFYSSFGGPVTPIETGWNWANGLEPVKTGFNRSQPIGTGWNR